MLTGWTPPFKLDRGLDSQEKRDELLKGRSEAVLPDDGVSLISFNSTYIEFVNRSFKIKGMAPTLVSSSICVFVTAIAAWVLSSSIARDATASDVAFGVIVLGSIVITGWITYWKIFLRHDLFTYSYSPVRFNKKRRMVYFFKEKSGKVVKASWDDSSLYFHIGRGSQNKNLRDIRCHLLDSNGYVTDTFTVGHSTDDELRVREQWEFICRYMESGPEHVVDHPLDGVITLSVKPSWKNCYMWVCFVMGNSLFTFRHVLFPIYGLLTLSRWLTFKTCKDPVWPKEIQAECAVQPNDPHRWPEPEYIGQFANRKDVYDRAVERNRLRKRR